jgi:uncharacterized protein (UPF0332 family)
MSAHWDAASMAAKSAQLLFDSGDHNGAVNRAYYAMFHAAKAALEAVDPKLLDAKTHTTVIRRFGQHVVGRGGVDQSIGRSLARVEQMRLVADYDGPAIGAEEAQNVLAAMRPFLAVVAALLKMQSP